jgi:hypothetical protein
MKDEIPWFAHLMLLVSSTFVAGIVVLACHQASVQRSRLEAQIAEFAAAKKNGAASSLAVQSVPDASALTALGFQLEVPPRRRPTSATGSRRPPGGVTTHLRSGPLDTVLDD